MPELLTEVTSREEHESDTVTPCWNESKGLVMRKGTKVTVAMARNTKELRIRHRILANAWVMVHLNHTNRTWLSDFTPSEFAKFTDFVLGERVASFSTKTRDGSATPEPSWRLVLDFEHALRRAAYEKVQEGCTLKAALEHVQTAHDLRHEYFTTPYQLEVITSDARNFGHDRGSGYGYGKGKGNYGADAIANVFAKGKGKSAGKTAQQFLKGKGGKAGTKGVNRSQMKQRTFDGREICFEFNKTTCDGACGRVHVCKLCFKKHPMFDHEKCKNDKE